MKVATIYSICVCVCVGGVFPYLQAPEINHAGILKHLTILVDLLLEGERKKRKQLILHLRFPATTKSKRLEREALGEF